MGLWQGQERTLWWLIAATIRTQNWFSPGPAIDPCDLERPFTFSTVRQESWTRAAIFNIESMKPEISHLASQWFVILGYSQESDLEESEKFWTP